MSRKVYAIAIVQFVALTWLAAILPTWQDEEFTLATTAHGVGYAIHRALTYELQAPLYFALVALLRSLDRSVFFAREFSVVTQIATTLVCARIARRIWPERDPWIFCGLIALNWFSVFTGVEIRTYSLALLESAALLAFAIDGYWLSDKPLARVAFVACAIAGLYTQYFIAFEIAAIFVALVVARRFGALAAYAASVAIALVAFVPLGLYVRGQASDGFSIEGSTAVGFGGTFLHPTNLVLVHPYTVSRIGRIVWVSLLVVCAAAFVLGRPRLDTRKWAFVSLFLVVDAIYAVLGDVLQLHLIFPRHYIALFLPQMIVAYALVAGFTSRYAGRCGIVIALVFAATNAWSIAFTYGDGAKLGDSARVGAFLTKEARAGDAIAVYPGDAVPSVARYYGGTLPIEGYPVPQDQNVYHVDAALVRSTAEANAAFDRLPHARRLWFDLVGVCDRSDVHGCLSVRSVMATRFRILGEHDFSQAIVFELQPIAR